MRAICVVCIYRGLQAEWLFAWIGGHIPRLGHRCAVHGRAGRFPGRKLGRLGHGDRGRLGRLGHSDRRWRRGRVGRMGVVPKLAACGPRAGNRSRPSAAGLVTTRQK